MAIEAIEEEFRRKVCSQIHLRPEGINRYRVFTPFVFDDGDNLAIVLKDEDGAWTLTDEGHTLMHLTYSIDARELERGTRQKVIASVLSRFGWRTTGANSLFASRATGLGMPSGVSSRR